jgi:sensor histidine kinase YesM
MFRIVKQKNSHALRRISPRYYAAFTVVGATNVIVLSAQLEYVKNNRNAKWVFILVAAGIILQMTMVLILAVSRNLWKEKESMNSRYLSMQEKHYHYLENREEETKRFRHDIRSHLYMMEEFLKEEKIEDAKKYLRNMFDIVDASPNHISIGNPIVDAVLNQYISMCGERNIYIEIKGHMPIDCEIPAFDLCTIFSNLLQNAVEAAENSDNKTIFMQFRYDERNIYIREENTYKSICYKNGELISTKGANHGYGTSNIKKSIEKYGGMIAYEISEDRFVALLEMPQTIRDKK